jgi:hypothetical protein
MIVLRKVKAITMDELVRKRHLRVAGQVDVRWGKGELSLA